VRFEFKSGTVSVVLPLSLFHLESCLLVSWCPGGKCGMAGSDEDCGKSRQLGAEGRGW
jgi:hypothetical protein